MPNVGPSDESKEAREKAIPEIQLQLRSGSRLMQFRELGVSVSLTSLVIYGADGSWIGYYHISSSPTTRNRHFRFSPRIKSSQASRYLQIMSTHCTDSSTRRILWVYPSSSLWKVSCHFPSFWPESN